MSVSEFLPGGAQLPPIESTDELCLIFEDAAGKVLLHGRGIEKRGKDMDWQLPGGPVPPLLDAVGVDVLHRAAAECRILPSQFQRISTSARAGFSSDGMRLQILTDFYHTTLLEREPNLRLKIPYRQFRWMSPQVALGSLALPDQRQALSTLYGLRDGTWTGS